MTIGSNANTDGIRTELYAPPVKNPYWGYHRKDWIDLCEDLKTRDKEVYGVLRAMVYDSPRTGQRGDVRKLVLGELLGVLPGVKGKKATLGGLRACLERLTYVGLVSTPEGERLTTSSRMKSHQVLRMRIHDVPFNNYRPRWRNVEEKVAAVRAEAEAAAEAKTQLPPQEPPSGYDSDPSGENPNPSGENANPQSTSDLQGHGSFGSPPSAASSPLPPQAPAQAPDEAPAEPPKRKEKTPDKPNPRQRAEADIVERLHCSAREASDLVTALFARGAGGGRPIMNIATWVQGRTTPALAEDLAGVRLIERARVRDQRRKLPKCAAHGTAVDCPLCHSLAHSREPEDLALVQSLLEEAGSAMRPDLAAWLNSEPEGNV